jgi:hypothetical protein
MAGARTFAKGLQSVAQVLSSGGEQQTDVLL